LRPLSLTYTQGSRNGNPGLEVVTTLRYRTWHCANVNAKQLTDPAQ